MDEQNHKKMLEHNLAILHNYGIHYVRQSQTVLLMLQGYVKGEIPMTEDEISQFFQIAINANRKHEEMLRMSLEERMGYVDSDLSEK
jgi:hypothetical protein